MPRRKSIPALAALLLLGVSIAVCVRHEPQNEEPSYRGQKLSYWVQRLEAPSVQRDPQNGEALRAIGTNAIPFYLNWMAYKPSRARKAWNLIVQKGHERFGFSNSLRRDPKMVLQFGAYSASTLLGEQPNESIPVLLQCITNFSKPDITKAAIFCVTDMGPEARPILLSIMKNTNQSALLRSSATLCIARQGSNELVVSQLQQMRQDPDPVIRSGAAEAFQSISNHPAGFNIR